jgi:membrane protein implicated in regulation of membrane protease activity
MILALAILVVLFADVGMPWAAVLIVGAGVVDVAESLLLIWWSKRRTVAVGAEALVGKRGVAVTALRPEGQVKLDGELWRARAEDGVEAGGAIVVRGIDGLTLDVEPCA